MRLLLLFTLLFSTFAFSDEGYDEKPFVKKKVAEFKTLSEFKSIEAFEKYYKDYTDECLKHDLSTQLVNCYSIWTELWDRELNIAYDALRHALPTKELQEQLKTSELAWLKTRDTSDMFVNAFIDKKYENLSGTSAVEGSGVDQITVETIEIKNRTLLLKAWLHTYQSYWQ